MCDTFCMVVKKWSSFDDIWFRFGETQRAIKIHICIHICFLLTVCNKAWGNCILYNGIVICNDWMYMSCNEFNVKIGEGH